MFWSSAKYPSFNISTGPIMPWGEDLQQLAADLQNAIIGGGGVISVAGKTGVVTLQHTDITDWNTAVGGPYLLLTGGTLSGPGNLTVQGEFALSRSEFVLPTTLTANGATTVNWATGEYQEVNLTANATLTIVGWPASGLFSKLVLDITNQGAFNITWPAAIKWAGGTGPPTITSGAGKRDMMMVMTPDSGMTLLGTVVGQNFT